jgi:hypothetical protein
MITSQKKFEAPSKLASTAEENRSHASGLTMSRLLFARVDRVVAELSLQGPGVLPSRGAFMMGATVDILGMCEDQNQRFLPKLVVSYDVMRKDGKVPPELTIDNPLGAQRCGTHFSRGTEERIAAVVKRIGWSRNQFISEALRTLVDMCEDPSKRRIPLVVILYDAAAAAKPAKLRPRRA